MSLYRCDNLSVWTAACFKDHLYQVTQELEAFRTVGYIPIVINLNESGCDDRL